MSDKLPAFQFYPGDWMKDPALRSMSLSARGLWMDMLCIMFEAQPRGFLILNGKPALVEQLARMVGSTAGEVSCLVGELTDAGVVSANSQGCLYSRRMVRDDEIRGIRRACGKKGGNPNLVNQNDVCLTERQAKVQPKPPGGVNQKSTPSSSSSSSSSSTEKKEEEENGGTTPRCGAAPHGRTERKPKPADDGEKEKPRMPSEMSEEEYEAYYDAGADKFWERADRRAWPKLVASGQLEGEAARLRNWALTKCTRTERKIKIGDFLRRNLDKAEVQMDRRGWRGAAPSSPAEPATTKQRTGGGEEPQSVPAVPADAATQAWRWASVMGRLGKVIDSEALSAYVEELTCQGLSEEGIWLTVPTSFMRQWVLNTYTDQILQAVRDELQLLGDEDPRFWIAVDKEASLK
jgi:hypothetical protein